MGKILMIASMDTRVCINSGPKDQGPGDRGTGQRANDLFSFHGNISSAKINVHNYIRR